MRPGVPIYGSPPSTESPKNVRAQNSRHLPAGLDRRRHRDAICGWRLDHTSPGGRHCCQRRHWAWSPSVDKQAFPESVLLPVWAGGRRRLSQGPHPGCPGVQPSPAGYSSRGPGSCFSEATERWTNVDPKPESEADLRPAVSPKTWPLRAAH